MNLFEKHLTGQKVMQVELLYESISIDFVNGVGLTIHNNHALVGGSSNDLVGAKVEGLQITESTFVVQFSNEQVLTVWLTNDAYNGPEVMIMSTKNDDLIVWN